MKKLITALAIICMPTVVQAGEGHDAGYEWAQDKGIADPSDCGGNSQSFIEGCEEAAQEAQDDEESDEDDEDDDY